ncbi:MAG: aminoacyl-tRNA hydrolase [Patescibacteria group bacterium]
MKLIVGLGNIGTQYQKTRHNAGFMALDRMATAHAGQWVVKKNLEAHVCEITIHTEKVLLVKPQTNMNDSGRAVQKVLADNPQIDPKRDLVVVYDDVETTLGVVKKKEGGSAGGHNGIRSIIAYIGDSFWRIKIGVGRPIPGVDMSDYVLAAFMSAEWPALERAFEEVGVVVSSMVSGEVRAVSQVDPKIQAKIKALAD